MATAIGRGVFICRKTERIREGKTMLDVRRIRQNPQELRDMLTRRNKDAGIVDDFLMKD